MAQDTLETIARRHSVRLFTSAPVADELIRACLEAANRAPSAHNQQSWRFLVVRGERKRALAELVAARAGDFPRPAAVLLRLAARAIAGAPVVVGVANTGELIARGGELFALDDRAQARDFFRTMEIQSSAAAVENLLLAATSLGLGSVWLGVLYLLKDEVLAVLGEPAGEFMAVVPLGYPEREARSPGKKPLAERVRYLE